MSVLARVAERLLNTPLLLLPSKAEVILSVLAQRIGVNEIDANRFEGDAVPQRDAEGNAKRNRWGDPMSEPFLVKNGVGIITVTGSLVNRGAWVGANSGLTSYEGIQHQLKRAAENADVKSILIDLHSPGGEAVGAFETAALVRQVNASKPVTALVQGMAASAAYAIASGAGRIVTTETGVSGSIGVVLLHADYSRQLANEGITPTLIFAGAHKVDGNPFQPLSDSVQADLQAEVNAFYEAFLKTVAAGRGARMTIEGARRTEARTMIGQAAVDAGLADAVGTFDSVLAELSRAHSSGSGNGQSQGGRTSSMKGPSMSEQNGGAAAENAGGITQAQLDAAVARATADAETRATERLNAERARIAGLDKLAGKVKGNAKGVEIIAAAKADGSSIEATALKLAEADAFAGAAVLGALQQDDASAAGAVPAGAGAGTGASAAQTPEGWAAEYRGSAALQAEFGSEAAYVGWKKAEARGSVRILKSGKAA